MLKTDNIDSILLFIYMTVL